MPTGSQREINFIVVGLWAMHFKHVNSFNSLKYITSGKTSNIRFPLIKIVERGKLFQTVKAGKGENKWDQKLQLVHFSHQ